MGGVVAAAVGAGAAAAGAVAAGQAITSTVMNATVPVPEPPPQLAHAYPPGVEAGGSECCRRKQWLKLLHRLREPEAQLGKGPSQALM